MASTLMSRRDLDFLLHEWLDLSSLLTRPRFAEHTRGTVDAVLDLSERLATDLFRPHNRRNDLEEPSFDGERVTLHDEVLPAVRAFADAGLIGCAMDEAVGGLQLPAVVTQACFSWFQAANVGTSSYFFLTMAAANLLMEHGTPEQVEQWVVPMVAGECTGTMCLSEPQAGSSLADVATRAVPDQDEAGRYRLTGNKMWISGGDHELTPNICHLVLAKVPGDAPGVKGISLFLVPKVLPDGQRNDVVLAGLNHKMGYRGTVNTLLNLGEGVHRPDGEPGAVGWLVGERGRGLAAMFTMMNDARVGVGLGATALGYTGYLASLDYARTRPQGRPVAGKDPSSRPVAIIEHPDVRRMLLAQKAYVEGALALNLYCGRLLDEQRTAETAEERARALLLLDVLTPIAKSWPSQWCLEANSLAIQVLGGYGYTREYDVEQLYRDNRLNMIHEGTHGIQALDLLGRKVVLDGGAGLTALVETIGATVARAQAAGGEAGALGEQLDTVVRRVVSTTSRLWSTGDPALALANATVYLEAVGHVVVAWVWLEQWLAATTGEGDFYDGKRQAARWFFAWELPRTGPQLDLLDSLDRTTLDMPATAF